MAIATTATIEDVSGFTTAISARVEAGWMERATLEAKSLLTTRRSAREATASGTTRQRWDELEERYAEIVALGATSDLYKSLQKAEALLAVYYAMPALNLRPTAEGGFTRGLGYADGSGERLMSKRELDAYREEAYAQAKQLLLALSTASDHDAQTAWYC